VRSGLGQAGVDHPGQPRWPERIAQASRCADHEIEHRIVEGGKTIAAAIGNSEPEAGPLEANAKREADMRIVINNQKTTHTAPHALSLAFDSPDIDCAMIFLAANQAAISFLP
jgi:hypothetical protein